MRHSGRSDSNVIMLLNIVSVSFYLFLFISLVHESKGHKNDAQVGCVILVKIYFSLHFMSSSQSHPVHFNTLVK